MRAALLTTATLLLASGVTSAPVPQTMDYSSGRAEMVFKDGSRLAWLGNGGIQASPAPGTVAPATSSPQAQPVTAGAQLSGSTTKPAAAAAQANQPKTPSGGGSIIAGGLAIGASFLATGGFLLCKQRKFFCKVKPGEGDEVEKASREVLAQLVQTPRGGMYHKDEDGGLHRLIYAKPHSHQ